MAIPQADMRRISPAEASYQDLHQQGSWPVRIVTRGLQTLVALAFPAFFLAMGVLLLPIFALAWVMEAIPALLARLRG